MVPPHRCPYRKVEVAGLVWEGQNQQGPARISDQERRMVFGAFRSYGYSIGTIRIPVDSQKRGQFPAVLQNTLVSHASSRTLIILYYQDHAMLDRHNNLGLTNGHGAKLRWSDVVNAIIPVRCDVLVILNCSHAGAATNSRLDPARQNYEGHEKQVIMAVPSDMHSRWGSAAGFAACLEQMLRDRRTNWPVGFKGTPSHWVRMINHIIGTKSGSTGRVAVGRLVRPPAKADERPILLTPQTPSN